ncbi:MAG: hypothetical protein ACRCTJ_02765, partial [Brevinema sp.]
MKKLLLISSLFFLSCSKTYLEETKDIVHIKASIANETCSKGVLLFWETYWEFSHYSILRSNNPKVLNTPSLSYLLKNDLIKDSYLDDSAILGQPLYYRVIAYHKNGNIIGASDIL